MGIALCDQGLRIWGWGSGMGCLCRVLHGSVAGCSTLLGLGHMCLCPVLAPEGSVSPAGCLCAPSLPPQLLDQELQHELLAHHPVAHSLCYRRK